MFYNFVRVIALGICHILYKIRVEGDVESINQGIGVIVCSNHISLLDPVILAIVFKRKLRFMGKKELFSNRFFSYLLNSLGVFPVDRDNIDIKSVKTAINLLKNDEVLGIFPEGTRVKNVSEENMKTGIGLIALKSDAVIVPVKIETTYRFRSRIDIFVMPLIQSADYKNEKDATKKITKDVYRSIYRTKEIENAD